MKLLTTDTYPDVRDRLDRLASELRETKRELHRVRLERRISPTIMLLLVTALGSAVATGSLEAQTSGRIIAPFTVIDTTGRELFKVDTVNDLPRIRVGRVAMGTGVSGAGYIVVERSDGKNALTLGEIDGKFALRVMGTRNAEIASVGEAKVGGGVFVANDAAGKIRMLMSGTGELHAVDPSGRTRATMTADGAFAIRNAAGTTVLRVGESPGGAGQFLLANGTGNAMVEAGVLATGAGVVRAYPLGLGGPAGNLLGLGVPGTFIVGFLGSPKK